MFTCYYRLFDRSRKPVTAIAIYTGKDGKNMPPCYQHSFMGTDLTYKYNSLCIADYSDEMLLASNNPFALVLLTAKKALLLDKLSKKELMEQKLLLVKVLLASKKYSHEKIKSVLSFLRNYIVFDDPQINISFEKQFDQLTKKSNPMGIIEQIAEMMAGKKAEVMAEERSEIKAKIKAQEKFEKLKIQPEQTITLNRSHP